MTTYEIPPERWSDYFIGLSGQYQGWQTTVEVLGQDVGDQRVADGLPLQGLSFEKVGSQAGDILIEMGDAGTPYETHRIDHPRSVRVADTDPGAETDIQFEAADGLTTIVHLRPYPELPPA
jgi:hypothetical protein